MSTTRTRTRPRTRKCAHPPKAHRRRGVAMLLVIIAVSIGVVLAGAMLSRHENTPRIGDNARRVSAAHWSAHSAASFAEAVLQTARNWLEDAPDGVLFENARFGEAVVSVSLTRPDGSPATPADRELLLTATATVGGVSSSVERQVSIVTNVPVESAVNLEMPEFAVLATGGITVEDNARIAKLPSSPEARTSHPIKLGAAFSSLGSLDLKSKAVFEDVCLFVDARAGSKLESAAVNGGRLRKGGKVPFTLPVIAESLPDALKSLPVGSNTNTTVSGSGVGGLEVRHTLPSGGVYRKVRVSNAGVLVLDASRGDRYAFDELVIESSGVLQVIGSVAVHVKGGFEVKGGGTIEFASPGSSVAFFTGSDITIDNAAVGLDKSIARDSNRSIDQVKTYLYPSRLRIAALSKAAGGKDKPSIHIRGKAIALASIHNANGSVDIHSDAALIGRVTAADFKMHQRAALLYDPRLDPRIGFTTLNGPDYKDGAPRPALASALASLDASKNLAALTVQLATAHKKDLAGDPRWGYLAQDTYVATDSSSGGLLASVVETTVDTTTTVVDTTVDLLGKTTKKLLGGSKTKTTSETTLDDGGGAKTEIASTGSTSGPTPRASAKAVSNASSKRIRSLER